MRLETPVGAGIETGGSKGALNAELVLLGLHVVGNGLQRIEIIDFVDALDFGAVGGDVLVEDVFVVDKTVGLHGVRNTDDLVSVLQRDGLVDELRIRLRVGHVGGVGLPILIADRAVDLEQGRGFALGDFRLQSLLVGVRRCCLHLDLNARLLGVLLGQRLPCVVGFRLEVQIVDLARAVAGAGARAACGERADGHCGDGDHTYHGLNSAIHHRTFLFPISGFRTSLRKRTFLEVAPSQLRQSLLCSFFPFFANVSISIVIKGDFKTRQIRKKSLSIRVS